MENGSEGLVGEGLVGECSNSGEVNLQAVCDSIELEEPKLGIQFVSTEDAYKFYKSYASKIGFDVRKDHSKKNKNGIVTRVAFCCSKEGFRETDKRNENPSFKKPETRVGCKAHMRCRLAKTGTFEIVSFESNHNHDLVRTPMKHMLKINRSISEAQKAHAENADKSGISIKATMELFSREMGGRPFVGFLDKDYRNYIHRKRKLAMQKGDACAIFQYFDDMIEKNSSFFKSVQFDEDDMVTNIFWADARSISDYALFGDVVCFDTTYQTNEYGRPFAPFVGVNHHKQTVVFGAALLYDETIESFKWLFDTFLRAMSGKQPRTILTDQSTAMASAISQVFTETTHRLCVWHIYQNAAKNLNQIFHGSETFTIDFKKCMYDYEDEDEWLLAWDKMLDTYNLRDNAWLKSLFAVKEKWALVYGRLTFTADMKSTQRSESMNSLLKRYLKPSLDFLRFFEHYERVLSDRRYEELLADFKMMNTSPPISINSCMLQHGMKIYTPEVFALFQNEYTRVLNHDAFKVHKEGSLSTYNVCYTGTSKFHRVKYEADTQNVSCSCNKFTFVGILCSHALKVLDKKNVKNIPLQYIEKRWTRDAKARSVISYDGVEVDADPKASMGKRYGHLCRNFREIATLASEHEKLAYYANGCLIGLLRDLEEKRKILFLEGMDINSSTVNVSPAPTLMPINVETMKATGVKRKATVGRPRGRIKDPLEKRKSKSKAPANQTPKNQKNMVKGSQQNVGKIIDQEFQAHAYLKEPSYVYDGVDDITYSTQMSSTSELDVHQRHMTFTQLLQSSINIGSCISESEAND